VAGTEHTDRWAEEAYLACDDPRGQSGFRGDEAAWRRAREPILEAIDRSGTFLDIGCANGLLMETVPRWAGERGIAIEPFGVELSSRLASLARERLPHWRDRIFEGDAMQWSPPRRFDFVRTELGYVPERTRRAFAVRLLEQFLADSGRLIVCAYGSVRLVDPAERVGDVLRGWGLKVDGEAAATNDDGFALTRVAWVGRLGG
jgi:hypothetical protein